MLWTSSELATTIVPVNIFLSALSYKPVSFDCVIQLAGVGGAREHGWAGQQEQQPAEEKATMAQTGHPNHPADARPHGHTDPGKTTEVKWVLNMRNTVTVKFCV